MTTSLLFISGAGIPHWVWKEVQDGIHLPTAIAPRPVSGKATVTDYARAALDAVPEGSVTVVAHSAGGVVASEVVRLAPERVSGLIAVAAVIPATGASFTSSLPFPNRVLLPMILRLAGTRPPESAIRKGLAAGLDEPAVQRLLATLEPEPRSYFTSRIASNAALAALRRTTYLLTTDDAEIPAKLQRRYAARLANPSIQEIPGGHLPMLSHPAVLRSVIADFCAREAGGGAH